MPTRKGRIWIGFNATVLTLAVAGILVFLNLLAARHSATPFDCTGEGKFTLSPQTKKILQSLTEDVQATVFMPLGDQDREELQKMLDLYKDFSPRFKVRMIDPDRDSLLAEAYVKKYGAFDPGTIIFESGTRSAQVKGVERNPFTQSVRFADEESVLNALVKVRQGTSHKVYFLTGHGEKNMEGEGEDSYSQAVEALRAQNYLVARLNLAETAEVPKDCSVLVIAGPKTPLLEGEAGLVKKYLDEGGHVLFMLPPPGTPSSGLDAILREWKIKSPDLMVVDLLTRLLGVDPFTAVAVEYSDHEITRDFTTVNLFFPHARPVLVEGGEGTELLRTGKSSWAESDFSSDSIEYNPEKDLAGPLSLAVAEEKTVQGQGPAAAGTGGKTEASAALKKEEERKARLVVFGCSGFATDKWFLNSANGNLFLNAVNWLASEKSLISLAPKTFKPRTVSLTAGQYLSLLLWTVLLLPVAVLVLGLGVWLKRRRL